MLRPSSLDGGASEDGILLGVGSQGDGIKIVQRYLSNRVVATLGQSNYSGATDSGALRLYDVSGTETIRLSGKSSTPSFITSGNIGIGTTTPSSTLGVKTSGASGLVLEQDGSDTTNSCRMFLSSSTQTYGMFNNAGDWRFTYAAGPGNTSGTSLARFTNTGKYFRMESGTGGIQFQGNTAAASALNYYEQGSWTPALQNATVSYSDRSGTYVRIGDYVFVRWGFRISSISGQSGTVTITGLPFTSVSWGSYQEPNMPVSTGVLATADNAYRARVFVNGNATSLEGRLSNNADTTWPTSQLQNGSWIIGELFYNVP
jgi:hypothetical protein